jgi:hypothetical protein
VGNVNAEDFVLCGANSYEEKYYLNPVLEKLPERVKQELKIMCVLFVHEFGGILTLRYDDEDGLLFDVSAPEDDFLYDEIGSRLKIKEFQRDKKELLEALFVYCRLILKGE